jgi:hypothetical protein
MVDVDMNAGIAAAECRWKSWKCPIERESINGCCMSSSNGLGWNITSAARLDSGFEHPGSIISARHPQPARQTSPARPHLWLVARVLTVPVVLEYDVRMPLCRVMGFVVRNEASLAREKTARAESK